MKASRMFEVKTVVCSNCEEDISACQCEHSSAVVKTLIADSGYKKEFKEEVLSGISQGHRRFI